jgi:hypothetical protein
MGNRGNKICVKCGGGNGCRAFNCKHCDHPFKMKKIRKRPRLQKNFDWTQLNKGDTIRVVGGSGPYYRQQNGDKQYLTERGIYYIVEVCDEGLSVQSHKGGGREFLYMGPVCKSPWCTNLYRSPHKLLLKTKT